MLSRRAIYSYLLAHVLHLAKLENRRLKENFAGNEKQIQNIYL